MSSKEIHITSMTTIYRSIQTCVNTSEGSFICPDGLKQGCKASYILFVIVNVCFWFVFFCSPLPTHIWRT